MLTLKRQKINIYFINNNLLGSSLDTNELILICFQDFDLRPVLTIKQC